MLENSSACVNVDLLRLASDSAVPSIDHLNSLVTIFDDPDFVSNCGALDTRNVASVLDSLANNPASDGFVPDLFVRMTSAILEAPSSSFASVPSAAMGRIVLAFEFDGFTNPLMEQSILVLINSVYRITNFINDVYSSKNMIIPSSRRSSTSSVLAVTIEGRCSADHGEALMLAFFKGNLSHQYLQVLQTNHFDGSLYAASTYCVLDPERSFFAYISISESVINGMNTIASTLPNGSSYVVLSTNVLSIALNVNLAAGYNLTLPNASIHIVLPTANTTNGSSGVVFMQYVNDLLFLSSNSSQTVDTAVASVSYPSGISFSDAIFFVITLPPVTFTSGNDLPDVYQCVLFDKSSNQWSTAGCVKDEQLSNATNMACWCTPPIQTIVKQTAEASKSSPALKRRTIDSAEASPSSTTNFACLTIPGGSSSNPKLAPSEAEAQALQYIMYIGIGVSVPCCLIIFFVFLFVKTLRTFGRFIIMNLALSLAVALALFVTSINKTGEFFACRVTAIALHYLLLVAFSWMLANGLCPPPQPPLLPPFPPSV